MSSSAGLTILEVSRGMDMSLLSTDRPTAPLPTAVRLLPIFSRLPRGYEGCPDSSLVNDLLSLSWPITCPGVDRLDGYFLCIKPTLIFCA